MDEWMKTILLYLYSMSCEYCNCLFRMRCADVTNVDVNPVLLGYYSGVADGYIITNVSDKGISTVAMLQECRFKI